MPGDLPIHLSKLIERRLPMPGLQRRADIVCNGLNSGATCGQFAFEPSKVLILRRRGKQLLTERDLPLAHVMPDGGGKLVALLLGAPPLGHGIADSGAQRYYVRQVSSQSGGSLAVVGRRLKLPGVEMRPPPIDQCPTQSIDQVLSMAVRSQVGGTKQLIRLVQPSGVQRDLALLETDEQHGKLPNSKPNISEMIDTPPEP